MICLNHCLFLIVIVKLVAISNVITQHWSSCNTLLKPDCNGGEASKRANLPLIKTAYCYNNGTGLCKAVAGRFEFYFNAFTREILGPVEKSKYVDENGYHERVPIAYNTKGELVFNDRVINWAKSFVGDANNVVKFNLLYLKGINWCQYVERDNWPYRSAINDPYSNGDYHIYFFNKQSCITKKGKVDTQYNTRFTHISNLRIDQDMNPLIFVMEDNLAANESRFRIVKNKRQHWAEVTYKIMDLEGGRHFIEFGLNDVNPQIIDGRSGPLLNRKGYAKWTDINCLTDYYFTRDPNKQDSELVPSRCGSEETEMADFNLAEWNYAQDNPQLFSRQRYKHHIIEAALHCLQRWPVIAHRFFDIDVLRDEDWKQFAKDRKAFTAYTTTPTNVRNQVDVIMMSATYNVAPTSKYDEFYPLPLMKRYKAKRAGGYDSSGRWIIFDVVETPRKEMNFVDDIAYLHKCGTMLVILGPLYSEMPYAGFMDNQEQKFKIGSIDKLGLFEITNAFFAHPYSQDIYFYHRTNYVARHTYTCGSNDGQQQLVTATKRDIYRYRHGVDTYPMFQPSTETRGRNLREETFFKDVNIFKGNLDDAKYAPDAPDPRLYPYDDADIAPAPEATSNTWLIVVIAIAVIIIIALCLICLFKWRKKLFRFKGDLDRPTERSGFSSGRVGSAAPTQRSAFRSSAPGSSSVATRRSALSSTTKRPSAAGTQRSALSSGPGRSVRTVGDRISAAFGIRGLGSGGSGGSGGPRPRSMSSSQSRSQSRSASQSSSGSKKRRGEKN